MSRKEVPRAGLLKALLAGKATNAQGAVALRRPAESYLTGSPFRRILHRIERLAWHPI